ncbi:hypothetical protein ACFL2M_00040 [Patescibacteria group bacterium]
MVSWFTSIKKGKAREARAGGYTVVEFAVVVGVVAVLSTLVLIQFTRTTATSELSSAKSVITADVRKVVTWAQAGKVEAVTGKVPNGYGIFYPMGGPTYSIYAEMDGNRRFDTVSSSDLVVEEVDLAQDELIADVLLTTCLPGGSKCDLFVESKSMKIYADADRVTDLELNFTHGGSGDSETVTVDLISGQIN